MRKIQGKDPNINEFVDYDPTNCLARIYMTNSSKIDEIFEEKEKNVISKIIQKQFAIKDVKIINETIEKINQSQTFFSTKNPKFCTPKPNKKNRPKTIKVLVVV